MAHMTIDFNQVSVVEISSTDTAGASYDEEAFVVPIVIPLSEVGSWLALYDPTSSSSPLAADSRKIARLVLDALKRAAVEP